MESLYVSTKGESYTTATLGILNAILIIISASCLRFDKTESLRFSRTKNAPMLSSLVLVSGCITMVVCICFFFTKKLKNPMTLLLAYGAIVVILIISSCILFYGYAMLVFGTTGYLGDLSWCTNSQALTDCRCPEKSSWSECVGMSPTTTLLFGDGDLSKEKHCAPYLSYCRVRSVGLVITGVLAGLSIVLSIVDLNFMKRMLNSEQIHVLVYSRLRNLEYTVTKQVKVSEIDNLLVLYDEDTAHHNNMKREKNFVQQKTVKSALKAPSAPPPLPPPQNSHFNNVLSGDTYNDKDLDDLFGTGTEYKHVTPYSPTGNNHNSSNKFKMNDKSEDFDETKSSLHQEYHPVVSTYHKAPVSINYEQRPNNQINQLHYQPHQFQSPSLNTNQDHTHRTEYINTNTYNSPSIGQHYFYNDTQQVNNKNNNNQDAWFDDFG